MIRNFRAISIIIPCVIVFITLFLNPTYVFALTEGAQDCVTAANEAGAGNDWVNGADGCADNNTYATVALTGTAESDNLQATNFGFAAIGDDDFVDGVTVVAYIMGTTSGQNNVDELTVSLVKAGTTQATNKATAGLDWPTSETQVSYGGVADNWGDPTMRGSDIKNAGFGAAIAGVGETGGGNKTVTASIDHVTITVTYTVNSGRRVIQISKGTEDFNKEIVKELRCQNGKFSMIENVHDPDCGFVEINQL